MWSSLASAHICRYSSRLSSMLHCKLAALKPYVAEANTATSLAPAARASLRPCGWREDAFSAKKIIAGRVERFLPLMLGVSTGNLVRSLDAMFIMTFRASASWHRG